MRKSRSGVVFFSVAARNTPPRIHLGAADELGDATGITPPGINHGTASELGVATGNTPAGINHGTASEL
ncbi:hypothetical protein ACEOPN_26130, partial [Pseudomonas aeruginosa]